MSIFFAGHTRGMPSRSDLMSKMARILAQYGPLYAKYNSLMPSPHHIDADQFTTLQALDNSDIIVLDITYPSFEMGVLLEHARNRLANCVPGEAPKILCILDTGDVNEKTLWSVPRMLNSEILGYHTFDDCAEAIQEFFSRCYPNKKLVGNDVYDRYQKLS